MTLMTQRPDLGFVNQTLYNILNKLGLSGAYLLISRAIRTLEVVKKGSSKEEAHRTLSINSEGTIFINEEFWSRHIRSTSDAETVVLHELLHHVLGDFDRKMSSLDDRVHIAMDARINAFITSLYHQKGCVPRKSFLTRYYTRTGVNGLLRPKSAYKPGNPLFDLYRGIYANDSGYLGSKARNPEDIYKALCHIYPRKTIKVSLLGSGCGMDSGGDNKEAGSLPAEILDGIRGEIVKGLGQRAGWGNGTSKMLVNLISEVRKLDSALLSRYSITQKVNKLKSMWSKRELHRSPLPTNPSGRDLAKYVLWGQAPVLWSNVRSRTSNRDRGVAVYLDISGSVTSHLPRILRLVSNLDAELEKIFCFSTKLRTHTLEQLRRGELDTTGGTDFTCVGKHIVKEGFKKCVIITDGYAPMKEETGAKVEEILRSCAVILFADGTRSNWFSDKYDTYTLEEVVI